MSASRHGRSRPAHVSGSDVSRVTAWAFGRGCDRRRGPSLDVASELRARVRRRATCRAALGRRARRSAEFRIEMDVDLAFHRGVAVELTKAEDVAIDLPDMFEVPRGRFDRRELRVVSFSAERETRALILDWRHCRRGCSGPLPGDAGWRGAGWGISAASRRRWSARPTARSCGRRALRFQPWWRNAARPWSWSRRTIEPQASRHWRGRASA